MDGIYICDHEMLSLAPFNIPGAGNIAGAAMYLGLFILFMI
jgi:hypothetical protein